MEITAFTCVVLPAKERKRVLQLSRLFDTLSNICWKIAALTILWREWVPRYFPRLFVRGMRISLAILGASWSVTFF